MLINNAVVFRRFNILDDYTLENQLEEIDINFKELVIVNVTSGLAFLPMIAAQVYAHTRCIFGIKNKLQTRSRKELLIKKRIKHKNFYAIENVGL